MVDDDTQAFSRNLAPLNLAPLRKTCLKNTRYRNLEDKADKLTDGLKIVPEVVC